VYDWAVVWLPIITKLVEDFMNFHVSWYFRFRLGLGMNCHKRWLWMVNCSCVMDDNLIVIWIWVWCMWNYIIVRVNCETVGWVGESQRMREESGRSPVFHVPPGGTEAAARRPVSKVAGSTWLVPCHGAHWFGVLIVNILRGDGFYYLGCLNNK